MLALEVVEAAEVGLEPDCEDAATCWEVAVGDLLGPPWELPLAGWP